MAGKALERRVPDLPEVESEKRRRERSGKPLRRPYRGTLWRGDFEAQESIGHVTLGRVVRTSTGNKALEPR